MMAIIINAHQYSQYSQYSQYCAGCPRDAAADPADEPGQLAAELRLVRLPARSRDQDQAQVTEFTHLSGDKQCTFLLFSFSYSGYVEG